MVDGLWLLLAGTLSFCGVGWLALAKAPHWEQVRGKGPSAGRPERGLRVLGAVAVTLSLVACLVADHATIASLVWVMLLTASSLLVSFTLAFCPRGLGWLVAWAAPRAPRSC
jgi:Protein of unknown function (DUF3325)